MLQFGGWKLVFGLAACVELVVAVGCGGPKSTPAAATAVEPRATSTQTSAPLIATTTVSDGAGEGKPAADEAGDAALEKVETFTSSTEGDPPAPAPSSATFATERIVLLAPGNPIIVELRLSIDGQPHTAALERLVD